MSAVMTAVPLKIQTAILNPSLIPPTSFHPQMILAIATATATATATLPALTRITVERRMILIQKEQKIDWEQTWSIRLPLPLLPKSHLREHWRKRFRLQHKISLLNPWPLKTVLVSLQLSPSKFLPLHFPKPSH